MPKSTPSTNKQETRREQLLQILEFWKYFDALEGRPVLTLLRPNGKPEKEYVTTRRLDYFAGLEPTRPLDLRPEHKPIVALDLKSIIEKAQAFLKTQPGAQYRRKVMLIHLYFGVFHEKFLARFLVERLGLNLTDEDLFDVDSKPVWLYTARLVLLANAHLCANLQEVKVKKEEPPVLVGTFFELPTFWIYFRNLFLKEKIEKDDLKCAKVLSELGLMHLRFQQEVARCVGLPGAQEQNDFYLIVKESSELFEETGLLKSNNPWLFLKDDVLGSTDLYVAICPSDASSNKRSLRIDQGRFWLESFLKTLPSNKIGRAKQETVFARLQSKGVPPQKTLLVGFDPDEVPKEYRERTFRDFPLLVTTLQCEDTATMESTLSWFTKRLGLEEIFESPHARCIPLEDQEPPDNSFEDKILAETKGKTFWPWLMTSSAAKLLL